MPYLKDAVKSILNQSYKNFEFIIVNDASTDGTFKYLKNLKDKRIKLIDNLKNLGLAASLNKALTASKGSYIARMDADDVCLPNRLVIQLDYLEQNPQILSQAGEDVVKAINNLPLTPDKQIDARHIKGLPQASVELGSIHRGGLKIQWNTKLDGTVNGTNTVFTVPATLPDPKDDKFIVSVRGVLKTADAGDFTASNSNRTLTFTSAPPDGSDSPRIIIYHGR